jgi:hypothetical protein
MHRQAKLVDINEKIQQERQLLAVKLGKNGPNTYDELYQTDDEFGSEMSDDSECDVFILNDVDTGEIIDNVQKPTSNCPVLPPVLISENYKTYIENTLEFTGKVKDISLCVITMSYAINGAFNVTNIFKYYPLSFKDVVTIKTNHKIRTIQNIKQKKTKMCNDPKGNKKKRSSVENFYNQITIVINLETDPNPEKSKHANVKLFNNGSVQASGIQSIEHCNLMINKILRLFEGVYGVFYDKNGIVKNFTKKTKFKEVEFIEQEPTHIVNMKLNLINSKYLWHDLINLKQTFNRLQFLKNNKKIDQSLVFRYTPDIHAPVHIKRDIGNRKPATVLIFGSGKILLMASKNREQILDMHEFVNKILEQNYDYVVKRDLLKIVKADPELSDLIDVQLLAKANSLL